MRCRDCNVLMTSGTTYEPKGDKDKGWKRFNECPKCRSKVYTKAPNFQEVLAEEMSRNRNNTYKRK